jgi:hypothetical protein
MLAAAELINDNGISAIALAFFTALFGMVGTVTIAVLQQRSKLRDIQNASDTMSDKADKAARNTEPIGNGFAARMDRKLDLLATNQDRLEQSNEDISRAIREHLEWHINKETS